jgi:ribonuclease-3
VAALAAKLGVQPRRPALLRQALTHKSAEQELNLPANERLEFLGDAVLDLVLAEHLFHTHPDLAEGDLTKVKAVAVSEPVLAEVARELGVGLFLLLARGEEQSGGRDRSSILADAMEAIFAAVYLDRGLRAARDLVLRLLGDRLHMIESREYEPDYKTVLQEKIQEVHRTPPTYRVVSQTGPDHDRTFVAEVRIGKTALGSGAGKSKKQAEQAAARQALLAQD